MDSKSQSNHRPLGQDVPTRLAVLDPSQLHTFLSPVKRINEGHDVPTFLTTRAYSDIGIFLMQLNKAMCPRKSSDPTETSPLKWWPIDDLQVLSKPVRNLQELLHKIGAIIEEAPPDTGPRRFGNVSFRKWYEILESRVQDLSQTYLPKAVLEFNASSSGVSVLDELTLYLLGSFGSSQRLDYGTGHELSFLAFLGCVWKLGGFSTEVSDDGALERSIVLGVIEPYLNVVRRLIITYSLEPAGSHGVWGLDDHSFLPYIFGSAQYCPPITPADSMPVEGSMPGAPDPGDIVKKNVVDRERKRSMYLAAIGFINDVKTGPFWEHSPILFDISGVPAGWGKINKGMIKMFNAEVLSKFPVVQHFPFGSLFSWEQDPNAPPAASSTHTASQPASQKSSSGATASQSSQSTRAPWARQPTGDNSGSLPTPRVTTRPSTYSQGLPPTRAPWAPDPGPQPTPPDTGGPMDPPPLPTTPTRAPWANERNK